MLENIAMYVIIVKNLRKFGNIKKVLTLGVN